MQLLLLEMLNFKWFLLHYLSVDGANDGSSDIHAGDEAVLEVTVEDEGLQ